MVGAASKVNHKTSDDEDRDQQDCRMSSGISPADIEAMKHSRVSTLSYAERFVHHTLHPNGFNRGHRRHVYGSQINSPRSSEESGDAQSRHKEGG